MKQIAGVNEAVFFGWNGATYLGVNDGSVDFSSSNDFLAKFSKFQPTPITSIAGNLTGSIGSYII